MDRGYAVGGQALILSGLNRGLFNMQERTTPEELQVHGTVPDWLSGCLYRIGPGKFSVPLNRPTNGDDTFEIKHWFDGLSQVHRFEFKDGRIIHRSKDACEELEKHIKQHGNFRDTNNFAQPDPCRTIFGKAMNFFCGSMDLTKKSRQNVNVTITPHFPLPASFASEKGSNLVAKTDSVLLQLLDSETLEPLEQFDYSRFDSRLDGNMAASHAIHFDGALYNFNLNVKRKKPMYHVFELRKEGVRILASTDEIPPTYMHSIQATERYICLTLWDGQVWGPAIGWHGAFYPSMQPPTGKDVIFCLFDRIKGGFIAKFEAPSFFAFHTINAYDDPRDGSVVVDLATVKDWRTMDYMYLETMRSGNFVGSRATRYRLEPIPSGYTLADPPLKATLKYSFPLEANIELMTSNPDFYHRPYRYTYGCNHQDSVPVVFSRIIKLDMSQPDSSPDYWSPEGSSSVGEPVFVPRPGSSREDDGILLSVVTHEDSESSKMVILDARDLTLIAEAECGITVPPGFHGTFEPSYL